MNQAEPEPERLSLTARALTATRLLFVGGLVAVFVFLALPTQAAESWRMDDFSINIEDVLPFALVFGLGRKRASAFASLQHQPPEIVTSMVKR